MKTVSMPLEDFIAEHERLIPMLRKAGLTAEADEQERELQEVKRKYGGSEDFSSRVEKRLAAGESKEFKGHKITVEQRGEDFFYSISGPDTQDKLGSFASAEGAVRVAKMVISQVIENRGWGKKI
jgi:hypothetical protein